MSLSEIYHLLSAPEQAAFLKLATSLFSKATGALWEKVTRKEDALAAIYTTWQASFQSVEADEAALNQAFADFFSRPPVIDELAKIGRDQYRQVDFNILLENLREVCNWAKCPLPADPHHEIESWLLDLRNLLEDNPQHRIDNNIVREAVSDNRSSESLLENDSLARIKYLDSVISQHRKIRFSGMAFIDEKTDVDMARVFVMPRVTPQSTGLAQNREKEPKAIFTPKLFTGPKAPRRLVILGGPGRGKTTLLEALAVAFAKPDHFTWSKNFPPLLPIFYRIRELEEDLAKPQNTTIWDCIQFRCSREKGDSYPLRFFRRQMDAGGLVFLFDGLDEASSPAKRDDIVNLLAEFAAGLSPESRMLVSSRPHDYRRRFDDSTYAHFDLCEFNDEEIQTFIQHWKTIHEPDPERAKERGHDLWEALQARGDIMPLARNALLLTMIVRVHFISALPESRLGLYEKCTETLLLHWTKAKDLPEIRIGTTAKHKLLANLAYEMQGEAEQLSSEMTLQIARSDLARRFERYLRRDSWQDAPALVDEVIHRLQERDAILVKYGTDNRGQDLFGFVHRSFQEYFAACWMADELDEAEFQEKLFANRDGWAETLYLAVAKQQTKLRRKTLLKLLAEGRAEFAVECLRATVKEDPWLQMLVQFLARHTWGGREHEGLRVAECANACAERPETLQVLKTMFEPAKREGQSLAAAVELAEELAARKVVGAQDLLHEFFKEAIGLAEDMITVAAGEFLYGEDARSLPLPSFSLDRFPVTNAEYERMVQGHKALRGQYSETDRQPVVNVNWFEAGLYARWRGCRLPSEQEWEKAAGWDAANHHKRVYPWGDEFDASRCNTAESDRGKTSPVGDYPLGRSACGCEDMAGNVWEWCENSWREGSDRRVVRGGSFVNNQGYAACACRYRNNPRFSINDHGFRCART